jgi:hypothetical protein
MSYLNSLKISQNTGLILNLQKEINDLSGSVIDYQPQIDDLSASILVLEGEYDSLASAITLISEEVDTAQQDIEDISAETVQINEELITVNSTLGFIQTELDDLSGSVDNLAIEVEGLEGSISIIQGELADLSDIVVDLSGVVDLNTQDIIDLSNVVSNIDYSNFARLDISNTFQEKQTFLDTINAENVVANKFLTDNNGEELVYGNYSNTFYVNDNETGTSGSINDTLALITSANKVIRISAGSYSQDVLVSGKDLVGLSCPNVGGITMTELAGTRTFTIENSYRIRVSGLQINGMTTISGSQLRHRLEVCNFNGGLTITGGGATPLEEFITIQDCDIAGSLTISSFTGIVYFYRVNFQNATFNISPAYSPQQVVMIDCAGIPDDVSLFAGNYYVVGSTSYYKSGTLTTGDFNSSFFVRNTTPSQDNELTSKLYVDTQINDLSNVARLDVSNVFVAENRFSGSFIVDVPSAEGNQITFRNTSVAIQSELQVYDGPDTHINTAISGVLNVNQSFFGGVDDRNVNYIVTPKVTLTTEPVDISDATTKVYVDTQVATKQDTITDLSTNGFLTAGSNITFDVVGSNITINSTGGGGATEASMNEIFTIVDDLSTNVLSLESSKQDTIIDLSTNGFLTAGSNIAFDLVGSNITINSSGTNHYFLAIPVADVDVTGISTFPYNNLLIGTGLVNGVYTVPEDGVYYFAYTSDTPNGYNTLSDLRQYRNGVAIASRRTQINENMAQGSQFFNYSIFEVLAGDEMSVRNVQIGTTRSRVTTFSSRFFGFKIS